MCNKSRLMEIREFLRLAHANLKIISYTILLFVAPSIVMSSTSEETLISRLSFRLKDAIDGMISISDPAKPSTIERDSTASSFGLLDKPPLELVHWILEALDVQSLSRVSRVSLRGKALVESLPAYQDMMEHAPHALTALGRIRFAHLHSISLLRTTLLSEQCVCCKRYGPFLFLPSCERCCHECLHYNTSLWVIPPSLAGKIFGLSSRQLRRIPTMRNIPGSYAVGFGISRKRSQGLLSVKAVKELAVIVYGREGSSTSGLPARFPSEVATVGFHQLRWFQEAPLYRPCRDLPLAT